MAVIDIIWPLFVRGLIKPLASLVLSGMRGSELLYQYVIVFTSCFVADIEASKIIESDTFFR